MVMSDEKGSAGLGLPKGYRDAVFLRERLCSLLPENAALGQRWAVVDGSREGVPLALIYSKISAPMGNSEKVLHIFPIDLARYPPVQIQAWVAGKRCDEVIVIHPSSRDALRSAGYLGDIAIAPVPSVVPAPLPKSQILGMASIFRYLDSRERQYDPEWLVPGYRSAEEPIVVVDSKDDHREMPAVKNLRFRLGATKRHFLNFVEELLQSHSGAFDLSQKEVAQSLANPCREMSLVMTGTVFTMVLDEFSNESYWADAVKAFCVAFRFEPNATLLIFLSGDACEQHARDFDRVLCAQYPFDCRLLLVQGCLDDGEYEALMACTDVYVDINRREGLHADLRHFSAAGASIIGFAARGEAGDYKILINFPVSYCNEPGFCDVGDDPRYQTVMRRLDWESLLNALTRAYVAAADASGRARVDLTSLAPYLEQQEVLWRRALEKAFA